MTTRTTVSGWLWRSSTDVTLGTWPADWPAEACPCGSRTNTLRHAGHAAWYRQCQSCGQLLEPGLTLFARPDVPPLEGLPVVHAVPSVWVRR